MKSRIRTHLMVRAPLLATLLALSAALSTPARAQTTRYCSDQTNDLQEGNTDSLDKACDKAQSPTETEIRPGTETNNTEPPPEDGDEGRDSGGWQTFR